MTDKEEALSLIKSLPEDVTFEQISYHLYVQRKLAESEADVKAGRVIDHEEVVRRMQKWLIK